MNYRRSPLVAIPSLEIDQPDCRRAAHSSSVGPIDEASSSTSRARNHRRGRKFIVLGFLGPSVTASQSRPSGTCSRAPEAKWNAGVTARSPLIPQNPPRKERIARMGAFDLPVSTRGRRRGDEDGLRQRHRSGLVLKNGATSLPPGVCATSISSSKRVLTAGTITCALNLSRSTCPTARARSTGELPREVSPVVIEDAGDHRGPRRPLRSERSKSRTEAIR